MKIAGIVCEYNPFHTGHAYHIARTRDEAGGDSAVICVMSGNFVQRGEAALYPKHLRAEAAVLGGADLVIELPTPWAMATAERFAAGAVHLLASTGIVDMLSFGSECGDIDRISRVADALLLPETDALIKENLAAGVTYAAAREKAVRAVTGGDGALLSSPNDILAIEYVKAIKTFSAPIAPLSVPRISVAHDGGEANGFASASFLREKIAAGDDVSAYLPNGEIYSGVRPVFPSDFEQIILYRLRTMTDEEYASIPDGEGDLCRRLMKYGRTAKTLAELLESVKTKRYTMSRIRRMITAAALCMDGTGYVSLPPYIRPLAFNGKGRELLAKMRKTASLPVITKPASARKLPDEAFAVFEAEARRTDIYALASRLPAGSEWTQSPIVTE